MHRIIKLIVTHILIFLLAFLGFQGYKKYKVLKIKHLLKVWKKKYHPFPVKREPECGSFFSYSLSLVYYSKHSSFLFLNVILTCYTCIQYSLKTEKKGYTL